MARPKKQRKRPGPRVQFNILVNEQIRDDLLAWCGQRGISASETIEDLMAALIDGTFTHDPASNQQHIAAKE